MLLGAGFYDPKTTALDADGQGIPYETYAFAAQMAGPNGVAVDGKGNLYVVDTAYNTVRKVWNGRRAR